MSWNDQQTFVHATLENEVNRKYPLHVDYQIAFLKHVIHQLEQHGSKEIHDSFYLLLAIQMAKQKPDFSYKHFVTESDNEPITVKESNSFVRDGTTGLKMWPAAMALGDFVLQNKERFGNKSILELGSGATGFVGLLLIKACSPRMVLLSDCHEAVIDTLVENVNLNLSNATREQGMTSILIRQFHKLSSGSELGVLNMPWEDIDKLEDELRSLGKLDVLLASDVVYDDSLFDALISCIAKLFSISNSTPTFYLSQTIRNPETFDKFCHLLHAEGFATFQEEVKFGKIYNEDSKSEIKILRIAKQQVT